MKKRDIMRKAGKRATFTKALTAISLALIIIGSMGTFFLVCTEYLMWRQETYYSALRVFALGCIMYTCTNPHKVALYILQMIWPFEFDRVFGTSFMDEDADHDKDKWYIDAIVEELEEDE